MLTPCNRSAPGWSLLAGLVAVALAVPVAAQNVPGVGMLVAKNKPAAKGCGRSLSTVSETLVLAADGTWTLTEDGGFMIGGTYVSLGSSGRKFDLALDGPSQDLVRGGLEADLSDLCGATVVVEAIDVKRSRVKLNRAGTKATLKVKFKLAGTADGAPGKASFKVKGKGPWVAGASPSSAFVDG